MRTLLFVLVAWCGASSGSAQGQTSLSDLRTQLESARKRGVSGKQVAEFSQSAFVLAEESTSRSRFWSVMGFVADLCESAPHEDVRDIRAHALDVLAGRFSDTLRWSSLLTNRFVPPFEQIPRSDWLHEIAEYDRVLDWLYKGATDERVKAELLYAKAYVRVHVDRRWDWLTDDRRRNTIRILETIQSLYGDLACPGSGEPDVQTVGHRAGQHLYELNKLHFGAEAPPTSGVDLEDEPLDIADYRGKIVVLDFWTSFCQPCLAMVPDIKSLLRRLEGEPVVYIGVSGDTDRLQAVRTAKRVEMTWPNLWDGPQGPAGPVATAWNVQALGWPSVFVLDAKGRIRYKLCGKQQVDEELERAIRTLLNESHATGR